MKTARLLAILWVVLQVGRLPAVASQAPMSSQDIFKKWHNAVVTIETPTGTGTGFFDASGLLYTAYHVMDGVGKATVTLADGRKGKVLGALVADKAKDYAILETDLNFPFFHGPMLGDYAALQPGEPITVIGSPQGLEQTITAGLVSAKREKEGRHLLQISAGISHGSSGSPVFNSQGEVVGLVTESQKDSQLLNFATASADLKGWSGIPLSVAFASSASGDSHLGLILCRADVDQSSTQQELEKSDADGYVGLKAVKLTVGDIPEPLAGAVTVDQVRQWATEALTKAGVRILSKQESDKRFAEMPDARSDLDLLKWYDSFAPFVHVDISGSRATDGAIDYSDSIGVCRPAVILPGWVKYVYIDNITGEGQVDAHADLKQSLEEKLKKDLATLTSRIQLANPPNK